MKQLKRQSRHLAPATRMKISKALKGRKLSEEHKRAIGASMRKHWSHIPQDVDRKDGR